MIRPGRIARRVGLQPTVEALMALCRQSEARAAAKPRRTEIYAAC